MIDLLRRHWPEYLMEAALLGCFMLSACLVTAALAYPGWTGRPLIADDILRRVVTGIAMGLAAIALIYSPWGKQSGAHMNPSTTLTFWRLGKVKGVDAALYVACQFIGGALGVITARLILGQALAHPAVHYVVTAPGAPGPVVAFIAEMLISFGMMTMVLWVSNHKTLASRTGLFAGLLVAIYISIEAPLSGMSMNPARSFGSAFSAVSWDAIWIYFIAPPLGMLTASEVYVRIRGRQSVSCAKLHHQNDRRCIFCGLPARPSVPKPSASWRPAVTADTFGADP